MTSFETIHLSSQIVNIFHQMLSYFEISHF